MVFYANELDELPLKSSICSQILALELVSTTCGYTATFGNELLTEISIPWCYADVQGNIPGSHVRAAQRPEFLSSIK